MALFDSIKQFFGSRPPGPEQELRTLAQAQIVADPSPRTPVIPQVQVEQRQRLVAPAPIIDKYPIIIGQNLTGQYLSSAYRLANQGWRYQLVDLLNELLEHDPHTRGVARQRVLATAGARIEVNAAQLPPNDKNEKLANEIAEAFEYQMNAIPAFAQAIGQLNWGVFYGLSGAEIEWDRTDEGWELVGLSNIHSRRLNYPVPTSWDVYIYDQGLVGSGYGFGAAPTNGIYGLRVADYPGKFICHAPALNGDYPTRDGEGRYVGMFMLLKRAVVRASAQDFERTIRPWVVGYFNRNASEHEGSHRSIAEPEDIEDLKAALQAIGSGAMNSAALSDSVKIEVLRAASNLNAAEFVSFLNREISKSLLGQAFTTEPGANGNFATAEIAKEGTLEIARYDARCLSDTLERDLLTPWMRLNYPSANRKLLPRLTLRVDELPEPETVMKIASQGAAIDLPIDAKKLSEMTGMPLVNPDDKNAIRTRMVAAGKAESPSADGTPLDGDPNAQQGPEDNGATPPERDITKPKQAGKAAKPQTKKPADEED